MKKNLSLFVLWLLLFLVFDAYSQTGVTLNGGYTFYCESPGKVVLKTKYPTAVTYTWYLYDTNNPTPTLIADSTRSELVVDIAGEYQAVYTIGGTTYTENFSAGVNLVQNGTFDMYDDDDVAQTLFTSDYIYVDYETWAASGFDVSTNAQGYFRYGYGKFGSDYTGTADGSIQIRDIIGRADELSQPNSTTNPRLGYWELPFGGRGGAGSKMLVVNGAPNLMVWSQEVDVEEGANYYFSAYVLNIIGSDHGSPGVNYIKPKLTFTIVEKNQQGSTVETQTFNTVEPLELVPTKTVDPTGSFWNQYAKRFYGNYIASAGVKKVELQIVNLASSGGGNDFALDDISFATLDPVLTPQTPVVSGLTDDGKTLEDTICQGSTLTLTAHVVGGCTPHGNSSKVYTWARPDGTVVKNQITGANGGENCVLSSVDYSVHQGEWKLTVSDPEAGLSSEFLFTVDLKSSVAVDDYTTILGMLNNEVLVHVLANDLFADNADITILTQPNWGNARVSQTNDTVFYKYTGGNFGVDSFQYEISDEASCSSSAWAYIFVNEDPDWIGSFACSIDAPTTEFGIVRKASTPFNVSTFLSPLVGDLDGDGMPEVVVPSPCSQGGAYNSDSLYVLRGDDLSIIQKIDVPAFGTHTSSSVGMFRDSSGNGLIVVSHIDGTLTAWDINGSQVWTSDHPCLSPAGAPFIAPSINIADIDNDGKPEIIAYTTVYNEKGKRLIDAIDDASPYYGFATDDGVTAVSIANFDASQDLEIAAGGKVYKPNFATRRLELLRSIETTASYRGEGYTTVADVDEDGDLDILVTTNLLSTNKGGSIGNKMVMYAWDGQTSKSLGYYVVDGATLSAPATVGNIDTDPGVEFIFITRDNKFRALKYNKTTRNFDLFWRVGHTDASGRTTVSLFDFNNDGIQEIVYRDHTTLRIMNGNTLTVDTLAYFKCGGGTVLECPTIADVDNDGSAEIIVAGDLGGSPEYNAPLHIFKNEVPGTWLYARPVWNQYMYNGLNVNNDLTIPQYRIDPAIIITKSDGSTLQPFNSIMKQYTYMDFEGNPIVPAPDLSVVGIENVELNDGGDTLIYTIKIENLGDGPFQESNSLSVALYCGSVSGPCVYTDTLNVRIAAGTTGVYIQKIPWASVSCQSSDIVIRINDDGSGSYPNSSIQKECDFDDNEASLGCISNVAFRDVISMIGIANNVKPIPVLDNDVATNRNIVILSGGQHLGTASVTSNNDTIIYTIGASDVSGIDSIHYQIGAPGGAGTCYDSAWVYIVVGEKPDWIVDYTCYGYLSQSDWNIEKTDSSTFSTSTYFSPLVGDLNGDNIPEIITLGYGSVAGGNSLDRRITNKMYISQGNDIDNKVMVDIPYAYWNAGTVALMKCELNGVDTSLIIIAAISESFNTSQTAGQGHYVYAYNYNGQMVWKSDKIYSRSLSEYPTATFPSIADIDNDGNPEILVGTSVFSHYGKRIVAPISIDIVQAVGCIVDIDFDGDMEFATMKGIYDIKINDVNDETANSMTLMIAAPDEVYNIPAGVFSLDHSLVTVADFNMDGYFDVFASVFTKGLYIWSTKDGSILYKTNYEVGTSGGGGGRVGSPLIGDFTGDGNVDFVQITDNPSKLTLDAYTYNTTSNSVEHLWSLPHSDASGGTGMTLFDFNYDGIQEIVYRDETTLRIINGSLRHHITGAPVSTAYALSTFPAYSGTGNEYPVIADIDGDGESEIIISNAQTANNAASGRLEVFSSGKNTTWAATRRVWNQYYYNAVNVNEDLTVPQFTINPTTYYIDDNGKKLMPYNNFYQQKGVEDVDQNFVVPQVDLSIDNVVPQAVTDSIEYTLTISNTSDADVDFIASDSAVAFYCGSNTSALWVDALPNINAETMGQNVVIRVPNTSLATCSSGQIRIVVGDKGQGVGVGMRGDCNPDNNQDTVSVYFDYGDLPAAYNMTSSADGGAVHALDSFDVATDTARLMLGHNVDSELNEVGNAAANSDNHDDAFGSGMNAPVLYLKDSTYTINIHVENPSSVSAKVFAWLDINMNNTFAKTEAAYAAVPANFSGEISLQCKGINAINTSELALRIRLSADPLLDSLYFKGVLSGGEVEDYMVEVSCAGVAKDYFATITDGLPITVYPLDSVHFSPVSLDNIRQPNNGTAVLHANDSLTYTPDRGFVGADSIRYYITANGFCVDSAWVIITTDCLPHKIPDVAMEVCLDSYTGNINFVEYMPYADMDSVSVWDSKGNKLSNPAAYPASSLKKDNTTVFTYYYEKAGFCVGSAPGKIYVNSIRDDRYAIFKDKTISVCCVSLKNGGYKLSSMLSYVSDGGNWGEPTATGTSVNPNNPAYLSTSATDGKIFDAEGFWNEAVSFNAGLDKVRVTIPYTTGTNDHCAGASKTVKITIEITKD
ncbi:MAG: Ig-like domain-containing protein [Bacteroidales bacterium]